MAKRTFREVHGHIKPWTASKAGPRRGCDKPPRSVCEFRRRKLRRKYKRALNTDDWGISHERDWKDLFDWYYW